MSFSKEDSDKEDQAVEEVQPRRRIGSGDRRRVQIEQDVVMGNQAQSRASVLRLNDPPLRGSSEPVEPSPPAVEQDSPNTSRSPQVAESEFEYIGPFGKKQKITRISRRRRHPLPLLRPDDSSSESIQYDETSPGSSSRTRESESPQGPSRLSVLTTSPMRTIVEDVAAGSGEQPLNLSRSDDMGASARAAYYEQSQSKPRRKVPVSPRREVSVIKPNYLHQVRRPGRPTNASYAAEAATAAAAAAVPGTSRQALAQEMAGSSGGSSGDQKTKPKKKYKCSDCNKEFSQLRNFRYHRSRHEGTNQFACTCPICGKAFNDKGYLSSHLKIHKNAKEYKCEYCEKSFNQRVAYNMHVRIHTGLKPHQCHLCPKAFSRKMLLRQHLRTHTGERPYHCLACPKSFADRSNMLLHQRLHTGERPYRCEICGKTFSKNHHLKTHMNHHLGIRPYTCVKCESKFSQSSNMKTHMKKCTGVKQKPRSSGPRATYQQVQSVGPDLPVPSPDVTNANAAIMHAIMNQAGPNRQAAGAAAIALPTAASALPDDTELINYVNPMISIQPNLPAIQSNVPAQRCASPMYSQEFNQFVNSRSARGSPTRVIRGPSPSRRRIPPTSTVTTESLSTSTTMPVISPSRAHTIHYGREGPAPVMPYVTIQQSQYHHPQQQRHLHPQFPLSLHHSPPQAQGPGQIPIRRLSPIIPLHQLVLTSAHERYSPPTQSDRERRHQQVSPSAFISYNSRSGRHSGNTSPYRTGSPTRTSPYPTGSPTRTSPYHTGSPTRTSPYRTVSPTRATPAAAPATATSTPQNPTVIPRNLIMQIQQQQQMLQMHQFQVGYVPPPEGSGTIHVPAQLFRVSPPRSLIQEGILREMRLRETQGAAVAGSHHSEMAEMEVEDQRRSLPYWQFQQQQQQQQQMELQRLFEEEQERQRQFQQYQHHQQGGRKDEYKK